MLTRRTETSTRFSRRDVPRVLAAGGILVLALTADPRRRHPARAAARRVRGPARDARHRGPEGARLRERGPDRGRPEGRQRRRALPVHVHDRERDRDRGQQQVAFEDRVGQIDTAFSAGPERRRAARRCSRPRFPACPAAARDDARRPRRGGLGDRPDRSGAGARRHAAHRAARYRGGRDAAAPRRPDGRRPRRGRADARGRAHRAARRRQLLARPRADRDRPGAGRGRGRPGSGGDPPGRGHRPQRLAPDRHRHREDRRARAERDRPGRREPRRLVPAGAPRRRAAARLDLALPAGALAPQQRADPDRAAARRRDARAQGHRRTGRRCRSSSRPRRSPCSSRSCSMRPRRRSSSPSSP